MPDDRHPKRGVVGAAGRQTLAAVVGLALVVLGQVLAVIALLLSWSRSNGGDFVVTTTPHYGWAAEYGVVAGAAVIGGLAAAAAISRNPRPVLATLVGLAVLFLFIVLALAATSPVLLFFGPIGAVAAAMTAGRSFDLEPSGQYPTVMR